MGGIRPGRDSASSNDTYVRRHHPHAGRPVPLQRLVHAWIPKTINSRSRSSEAVRRGSWINQGITSPDTPRNTRGAADDQRGFIYICISPINGNIYKRNKLNEINREKLVHRYTRTMTSVGSFTMQSHFVISFKKMPTDITSQITRRDYIIAI